MIAALCVAGVAGAKAASPAPTDIVGRWTSTKGDLVLDVSPCGTSWCGVRVDGGACGMIALRLEAGEHMTGAAQFRGRLQLVARTASYAVRAELIPGEADDTFKLSIVGNTGKDFAYFARTFPYNELFVRSDKVSCLANQKTS
jgi:hypothetical protein